MYWQVLTDLPLPGTLPDSHAPALRTFSASLSTHFPFLYPHIFRFSVHVVTSFSHAELLLNLSHQIFPFKNHQP